MRRALVVAALLALGGCSGGADDASEEPIVLDDTTSAGAEDETSTDDLTGPDHGGDDPDVMVEDECTTDEDCVPAGCCHASACVAATRAPDCSDVMCTMNCEPNTLDCGGSCVCVEGRCDARFGQTPSAGSPQ